MVKHNSEILDKLLVELGRYGKFNVIQFILLSFPMIISGFYSGIYIFETLDIDYRCAISECENLAEKGFVLLAVPWKDGRYSKCTRYTNNDTITDQCIDFNNNTEIKCETYIYTSDVDSVVKDFDLGCKDWKRTLVGSICSLGLFVALPLYGYLSDKYGRRVAIALSGLLTSVISLIKTLSINYEMFIVLEFLISAIGGGIYDSSFVLGIELVDSDNRVLMTTFLNIMYSFGSMALPLLAWWLNDWRRLVQVISIPTIFLFSYIWVISESYRWLLTKNKNTEVIEKLKYAAKINKCNLSEQFLLTLSNRQEKIRNTQTSESNNKFSFLQIIKSKILLVRLLICSYQWIVCAFVYFGLQINSISLAGNMYINYVLTSFIEIPAGIFSNMTMYKYGRKSNFIASFILNGLTCIGLAFLQTGSTIWPLLLYLFGKCCITISYNIIYVYASELFPTNMRQSLLAISSTFGMIGACAAPFTPLLAMYYKDLPLLLFGSAAFIAGVLVLLLPETKDVILPNTVEEAENISKIKITRV